MYVFIRFLRAALFTRTYLCIYLLHVSVVRCRRYLRRIPVYRYWRYAAASIHYKDVNVGDVAPCTVAVLLVLLLRIINKDVHVVLN